MAQKRCKNILLCYIHIMAKQNTITALKKFKKTSAKNRREFLRTFEEKMIYRTTKTENPQTTQKMVRDVLSKVAVKK